MGRSIVSDGESYDLDVISAPGIHSQITQACSNVMRGDSSFILRVVIRYIYEILDVDIGSWAIRDILNW